MITRSARVALWILDYLIALMLLAFAAAFPDSAGLLRMLAVILLILPAARWLHRR